MKTTICFRVLCEIPSILRNLFGPAFRPPGSTMCSEQEVPRISHELECTLGRASRHRVAVLGWLVMPQQTTRSPNGLQCEGSLSIMSPAGSAVGPFPRRSSSFSNLGSWRALPRTWLSVLMAEGKAPAQTWHTWLPVTSHWPEQVTRPSPKSKAWETWSYSRKSRRSWERGCASVYLDGRIDLWRDKAKRISIFPQTFLYHLLFFPWLGRGEVIRKEGPLSVGKLGRRGVRAIRQVRLVRLVRGVWESWTWLPSGWDRVRSRLPQVKATPPYLISVFPCPIQGHHGHDP